MNAQSRDSLRGRPASKAVPFAVLVLLLPAPPPAVAAGGALLLLAMQPSHSTEIGAGRVESPQARQLADWIALTGDHAGVPFLIVDKKRASILVFDASARLHAHSAVLLGSATGDDSVPGIGTRPMAQILEEERTTPAGRFVGERGRNTQGEDVVWVDYDAAVSIHRLRASNRRERRAERMATPSIDDNRISYGCINVPVKFYDAFVQPIFAQRKAMVYVLPDTRSLEEVFGISSTTADGMDANRPAPPDQHGYNGVLRHSNASRKR